MPRSTAHAPAIILCVAIAALVTLDPTTSSAAPFQIGDVVVAAGDGKYEHYGPDGGYLETLDTGAGGLVSECAFNSGGSLYTTNFITDQVVVLGASDPHVVIRTIDAAFHRASGIESIVFARNGDFFLGSAEGDRDILRFAPPASFIRAYDVPVRSRGANFLDLSTDQHTMFYTSEDGGVLRFDLQADRELPPYVNLDGKNFGLRLLPPGDGSGGILVASFDNVRRVNPNGAAIQTYDAPGEDHWFTVKLDPNGTSFWAAGLYSGDFYRFDLATGAIQLGPLHIHGVGPLAGMCVVGEVTAANQCPFLTSPTPQDGQVFRVLAGETVQLDLEARDRNPTDVVALSLASEAQGFSFTSVEGNPARGRFEWTPTEEDRGAFPFALTASDGLCSVSARFVVEVRRADSVPPVIRCPADITTDCRSPKGTIVTFEVSATDDRDPNPIVTCTPASGTAFPTGTTRVRCVARDASGNTSSCVFDVTILPADCPHSARFWRKHVSDWPATTLTLGTVSYSRKRLRAILEEDRGHDRDAEHNGDDDDDDRDHDRDRDRDHGTLSLELARELIAAKFNVLNCAGGPSIAGAIDRADLMIGSRTIPFRVRERSAEGREIAALTRTLEKLNSKSRGCRHRTPVEIEDQDEEAAPAPILAQFDPNPFSVATRIVLSLPEAADVRVGIFDLQGREVKRLLDGPLSAGQRSLTWDGRNSSGQQLPNGVYFYRMEAGGRRTLRKLVIAR